MVEEYSTYPTNIKCYEKLMSIGKGSYSNVFNPLLHFNYVFTCKFSFKPEKTLFRYGFFVSFITKNKILSNNGSEV